MSISQSTAHFASRTSLAGLFGLMLLSATGCMIAPLDGDTIPTTDSKIHCLGATQNPNDMIHVEAWNWLNNSWDIIEHANTGTSPVNAHGSQWYVWSTTIQIPEFWYWQFNGRGTAYAEIRSRRFDGDDDWEGEELWTFETWEFEPNMSLIDFYQQHGTAAKTVTIYSPNFVP